MRSPLFIRLIVALAVAVAVLLPGVLKAGSSEVGRPRFPAGEIAAFADRVQLDLAKRQAHVAIVARMGRDPRDLPPGVTYTHVSYWVFSQITRADGSTGQGYRVYNLYQRPDKGSRSRLVQDSPAEFFAGAYRLDAGIIVPDPRLQQKLLVVIASPTYAALHNPSYSVLSNPNTSQFQNCTEHTLDVLVAAVYGTASIPQIKANIAAYFEPTPIPVDATKRALAPIASQALTTADHGARVATATFGSIARFVTRHRLAAKVYRITPGGVAAI